MCSMRCHCLNFSNEQHSGSEKNINKSIGLLLKDQNIMASKLTAKKYTKLLTCIFNEGN